LRTFSWPDVRPPLNPTVSEDSDTIRDYRLRPSIFSFALPDRHRDRLTNPEVVSYAPITPPLPTIHGSVLVVHGVSGLSFQPIPLCLHRRQGSSLSPPTEKSDRQVEQRFELLPPPLLFACSPHHLSLIEGPLDR